METVGGNLFSSELHYPEPDQLKQILSWHKKPLNDDKEMWIVHPSPVSSVCLDFVFQTKLDKFNYDCTKLTEHLIDLEKAIQKSLIVHILHTLKRNGKFDNVKVAGEVGLELYLQKWIKFFDDIFNQRSINLIIKEITEFFLNSVRYYLIFGLVPLTIGRNAPEKQKLFRCNSSLETEEQIILSTVLNFHHNCALNPVISLSEAETVMLLTYGDQKFTCTDFEGNPYGMMTYDASMVYHGDFERMRTPYINMMQEEMETRFLKNQLKRTNVEKMTKSTVVVSSELNKRIKKQLDKAADQDAQNMSLNDNELKKKIEMSASDASKLKELHQISVKDDSFKSRMATAQAAGDISSFVDSTMKRAVFNLHEETESTNLDNLVRAYSNIQLSSHQIHALAPDDMKAAKSRENVNREVLMLKEEIKKCVDKLTHFQKTVPVLHKQFVNLQQSFLQVNVDLKVKEQKLRIITEEYGKLQVGKKQVEKELQETDRLLVHYESLMRDMLKKLVYAQTDKVSVLQDYTDRAEKLFKTNFNLYKEDKCKFFEIVEEILRDNLDNLLYVNEQDTERRKEQYAKALIDTKSLIIPFFTDVANEDDLAARNNFLIDEHFRDKPVRSVLGEDDKEMFEKHRNVIDVNTQKMIAKKKVDFSKDNITYSDINPMTEEDEDQMKQFLKLQKIYLLPGEKVYTKTFLNAQFSQVFSSGENQSNFFISSLKNKWTFIEKKTFKLEEDIFTLQGQKKQPKIGENAIDFFCKKFIETFSPNDIFVKEYGHYIIDQNTNTFKSFQNILRDFIGPLTRVTEVAQNSSSREQHNFPIGK